MSKPKSDWWGYAKGMIRRYPNKVNAEERKAVESAIKTTLSMRNGDIRMKLVEMVLMKDTHTIQGAAMVLYCSEATAKSYHTEFIREVGKNFQCNGLR